MIIFRALLSLLYVVPVWAQIRSVPVLPARISVPSIFAVAPLSLPSAIPSSLSVSLVSFAAEPVAPLPVPAARAAAALRDDADRLYIAIAEVHSRAKAGESESALIQLKRAIQGDFDGVISGLPAGELSELKALRKVRAAAEKSLDANPTAEASRRLAAVSGRLAAVQLKTANRMISADSPVGPRTFKRNAALWSLIGAHNSAAAAAVEADYLEALARGEEAFGDGRPHLYWSRWRNLHTELDEAARHARNGRLVQAAKLLSEASIALSTSRDARDIAAAVELKALADAPVSAAILSAKALIARPTLKSRAAVAYADLGAAQRSQIHALESARLDFLETAKREADLRRAAVALSSRRPTKAEKARALALARAAAEWAKAGRVEGKRRAALELAAGLAAAERGDLELAVRHFGWAADALAERRAELWRIGSAIQRRMIRGLSA